MKLTITQLSTMYNQALEEAIKDMDPDFITKVGDTIDPNELRAIKLKEVHPDRRELVQSRIDYLYRKSYNS